MIADGSPRAIRDAHATTDRTPTLEDVFVELVTGRPADSQQTHSD